MHLINGCTLHLESVAHHWKMANTFQGGVKVSRLCAVPCLPSIFRSQNAETFIPPVLTCKLTCSSLCTHTNAKTIYLTSYCV